MSTRPPIRLQARTDATATSTADDALNIPPTRRGRKFILAHAPSSWIFMDNAGWVPSLDIIAAVPGVNGVDNQGGLSGVVAQTANNGSTPILPSDGRLGDFKDYCVWYPCAGGGRHYCYKWEAPSILPDRTVVWDQKAAATGNAAFLTFLRDSGIVGTMHEAIYLREIQKQEQKVNDIAARMGVNPALGARLAAAEKRLDAMRASWQEISEKGNAQAAPVVFKGNVDAAL